MPIEETCVLATFRNNMHGGLCSVNKNWRAKEGEEEKCLRASEVIVVNVLKQRQIASSEYSATTKYWIYK